MSPKYLESCFLLKIFITNVDNLCPPLAVMKAKHINKVFISFHFTFFNFSFSAFSSFSHFWDDLTKFLAANWCKRKVVTPSSHSLNGPLYKWTPVSWWDPAFLYSPYLFLYKTDTSLRQKLSAGPKDILLRERLDCMYITTFGIKIEDITWLCGDRKFLVKCWKLFFNMRREIAHLQVM